MAIVFGTSLIISCGSSKSDNSSNSKEENSKLNQDNGEIFIGNWMAPMGNRDKINITKVGDLYILLFIHKFSALERLTFKFSDGILIGSDPSGPVRYSKEQNCIYYRGGTFAKIN